MTKPALLTLYLFATPILAAYTRAIAELEHYSLRPEFGPFVVRDADEASGGKVVVLPDEVGVWWDWSVLTNRQVRVLFTTTKKTLVHVKVRAFFPDHHRDSFVYRIDDGETFLQDWSWPTGSWELYGRSFPQVEPGDHQLFIIAREVESQLDKVDLIVREGEVFHTGPVLIVELESLSSQSSFSPFVTGTHVNATDGEYIVLPSSATAQLDPASGTSGQVEIAFTLTTTTDVNLAVRASFPAAASFYYKLDGEAFQTVASGETAGWVSLSVRNYTAVAAGGHMLVIKARETGAQLDSVSLLTTAGGVYLVREETPQPPVVEVVPEESATPVPFVVPAPERASRHGMSLICSLTLAALCVSAAF
ncbi:hypothetical protein DIPPA_25134 [Diplonema papillatum]|nr:hypothetical protein DIPPA_25134 [Diplonema papillatum]